MNGNPMYIPNYNDVYTGWSDNDYYLPPWVTHGVYKHVGQPVAKILSAAEPIAHPIFGLANLAAVPQIWRDVEKAEQEAKIRQDQADILSDIKAKRAEDIVRKHNKKMQKNASKKSTSQSVESSRSPSRPISAVSPPDRGRSRTQRDSPSPFHRPSSKGKERDVIIVPPTPPRSSPKTPRALDTHPILHTDVSAIKQLNKRTKFEITNVVRGKREKAASVIAKNISNVGLENVLARAGDFAADRDYQVVIGMLASPEARLQALRRKEFPQAFHQYLDPEEREAYYRVPGVRKHGKGIPVYVDPGERNTIPVFLRP